MKKITHLIGSGLLLTAAACSNPPADIGGSTPTNAQPFAGKKVLVAYYSHSGNTQAVAQQIARATGGELFRIETVQPYPDVYNRLVEQAQQEIQNGVLPELKTTVPDMAQYDVVFVGSPNWLGTYVPAVKSFLAQYDFSGKQLVPFFTHGGGGMQNCESDMHAQLPQAAFLPAGAFLGRSGGADADKLAGWLNKLAQ